MYIPEYDFEERTIDMRCYEEKNTNFASVKKDIDKLVDDVDRLTDKLESLITNTATAIGGYSKTQIKALSNFKR